MRYTDKELAANELAAQMLLKALRCEISEDVFHDFCMEKHMNELTNTASINQVKQMRELQNVHELAIQLAVSAWQEDSTKHLVMVPELAIVFAQILNAWIRSSEQWHRDLDFYRDLLDQCAKHIGPAAYTDDEGRIHDSPLRRKIPELVQKLVAKSKSDKITS